MTDSRRVTHSLHYVRHLKYDGLLWCVPVAVGSLYFPLHSIAIFSVLGDRLALMLKIRRSFFQILARRPAKLIEVLMDFFSRHFKRMLRK